MSDTKGATSPLNHNDSYSKLKFSYNLRFIFGGLFSCVLITHGLNDFVEKEDLGSSLSMLIV